MFGVLWFLGGEGGDRGGGGVTGFSQGGRQHTATIRLRVGAPKKNDHHTGSYWGQEKKSKRKKKKKKNAQVGEKKGFEKGPYFDGAKKPKLVGKTRGESQLAGVPAVGGGLEKATRKCRLKEETVGWEGAHPSREW